MRRLAIFLGFLVIVSLVAVLPAHAQSTEVYGGYSFVRLNPGGTNTNGWDAALTEKLFKVVGITADFGGTYTSSSGVKTSMNTFLFGPQVSLPAPVSPFVHALFGAARVSSAGSNSTSFASAVGGGIDIHPIPLIGLRLIQADYLNTHFGNTRQNDFRLSAGIVLHF
ncbi:MAG TPA: hypothetical protein VGU63_04875 [Candidatus Acidoferrales bacterium]|nr:hypothetical protein [Candidatus Acidoferrales bacterium]